MLHSTLTVKRLLCFSMTASLLSGCALFAGITPHENFKAQLYDKIGRSIDTIPHYSMPSEKQLIESKKLPNGNIENTYNFRGTCKYIYEIDSKTRKIMGARFEGNETDCVINP